MAKKAIPRHDAERETYTHAATPGRTPDRSQKLLSREYLVVGPKIVGGAKNGETVTLALTPSQETALIEAGHIVRAPVEKNRPLGRDKGKELDHG